MTVAEAHVGSAQCYDAGCIAMACRLAKTEALKAPAPDSRSIGSVLLIEPGCFVYSRDREYLDGGGTYPRGGVVVEITDGPVDEDGQSTRAFRCLRLRWGKVHADVITDAEVDRDLTSMPEDGSMRSLAKVAARELADSKGAFLTHQADLAKWIHVLTGLVMGAR